MVGRRRASARTAAPRSNTRIASSRLTSSVRISAVISVARLQPPRSARLVSRDATGALALRSLYRFGSDKRLYPIRCPARTGISATSGQNCRCKAWWVSTLAALWPRRAELALVEKFFELALLPVGNDPRALAKHGHGVAEDADAPAEQHPQHPPGSAHRRVDDGEAG